MAEEFNDAELAALEGDESSLNIGVIYKVMTTPTPIPLWLGIGDVRPGLNWPSDDGLTYLGCGKLVGVESYKQVTNGGAANATFVLSGVSQELLDLAETRSDELLNVPCWYGYFIMGPTWQPIGPPHFLWMMRGDTVVTDQVGTDPTRPRINTIAFTMRDELSARRRARNSFCIGPDQKARYSTPTPDKFFDLAQSYSLGVQKKWPPT